MKKNKLTFIIAASFLALGALVGCDTPAPSENSSINGATSIDGGSEVSGSSIDSGTSQNSSGDNTSQGGGGNTSQGGGQQTKTDWTDAEKATMKQYLHGLVLPFVEMDVSITTNQNSGNIKIQSQQNMASGFLASYAAKFNNDEAWIGGDISSEYNVYPGNAFAYQRKVVENGKNYYVVAMFTGLQFTQGSEEPTISKDGCFYLEAMDPYVYEYPATFIGQWLSQTYGSNIVPPAFTAEYYNLDSEGVLIGYSERNIENDYKTTVETSGKFTIDPQKNADGYYVCHPTDGKYVMYFKYDTQNKVMILMVEAPKGWNAAAINAIFRENNVTPFELPVINDENIQFSATAIDTATGVPYVNISVNKVNTQMVQDFVNGLKRLGYKVAVTTVTDNEAQWFTTCNVFTSEGMFTLYITYAPQANPKNLDISFSLAPNPNAYLNWPGASIKRYLDITEDTVPAFAGTCYGYSFTITNTFAYVVVHVDEGSESTARDSYIATLTTGNKFVSSGTLAGQPAFKSEDGHILVAISCDPNNYPGEIEILLQYIAVVDTPWPAESITTALGNLYSLNPITDTIPALNVADASDCYVNSNYSDKFEIVIDGLAANEADFIREFKTNGWTEDAYYPFDSTISQYGVLVSPNKQIVAMFDVYQNDLSIYVKPYWDPYYAEWPTQNINEILNKWGVSRDQLPAFNSASFVFVDEVSGEQKAVIDVLVGSSVRQTFITDYCVALEAIGYHYDQNLEGHISDNHELLIKFESYSNGVKIIVSSVALVYKVVGYNGNWDFANGVALVDATNPEENYEVQYSASFHVDANAEFKLLDSDNNWYGAEIASYSNSNNEKFTKLEGGNIKVNAAGTVTVYFKIYEDHSKDMWLEFVQDQPALSPWPSDAINAQLEVWNVDDEIPALHDVSITDVTFVAINEKSFALTIVGGASLLSSYNGSLGASFTYNDEKQGYVSENLLIKTHADQDNLIVVVSLMEEEPELEPWPEEALLEYFGEDTFASIPEIKIDGASYHVEGHDEFGGIKVFYIIVTVDDAPTKMAAAIEELENQFSYAYDSTVEGYVSTIENMPLYAFDAGDDQTFAIAIAFLPEAAAPAYKLVGSMIGWDYDDGILIQELEPEEGYLVQYTMPYYEVDAGEEFKITDGTGDAGWYGYEILAENSYFETNANGNIVAKQDGVMVLMFNILNDGTKQIVITFTPSEVEDHSWASAKAAMEAELPEGKVMPNIEVDGALAYDFNGSIDITFAEDTDMAEMVTAVSIKLEAAGYHYSERFMGFVNTSTDLCFSIEVNDNVLSVYCGENAYEVDEGYGFIILTYDEAENRYYPDDYAIGEVNPSNENEYMILEYDFVAGTYFLIYDFTNETRFVVSIDPASIGGEFADYFEYSDSAKAYVVKQDFKGAIYIKLSYGSDQIYVGKLAENP